MWACSTVGCRPRYCTRHACAADAPWLRSASGACGACVLGVCGAVRNDSLTLAQHQCAPHGKRKVEAVNAMTRSAALHEMSKHGLAVVLLHCRIPHGYR